MRLVTNSYCGEKAFLAFKGDGDGSVVVGV